ncbi:MAG: O-antigen ligase family protein, partial [Deltaproteobacteria bacterium]|nr:O-antigen ligase family protein [Deltaproteobacteria bacterium]
MTLYYLLLFVTPFHNDPRLGMTLIDICGGMIVTPVKVLGVLTVAAAILAPRPRANVPRLRNTLRPLFLLFAAIPVFAVLLSQLPIPTAQISQLISAALLLMATGIMVRTKERMLKSVRILVLAFAFSSLWVYKQYFIEHVCRAYGVEGESNYEALMLLLSMPMGFWMWHHEPTVWWRRIGLACGALLAGAVLLTQSRAGIIAAGIIALLAAVRSRHKLAGLAILMVAVSVTLAYGPAGLWQRFRSIRFSGVTENGDEGSTRIHVELLKAGVRMMESHPLLGVGMGQFKQVAPEYNPEIFKISTNSFIAHNLFIQTGAECGVPVLLLFVMMIAVA